MFVPQACAQNLKFTHACAPGTWGSPSAPRSARSTAWRRRPTPTASPTPACAASPSARCLQLLTLLAHHANQHLSKGRPAPCPVPRVSCHLPLPAQTASVPNAEWNLAPAGGGGDRVPEGAGQPRQRQARGPGRRRPPAPLGTPHHQRPGRPDDVSTWRNISGAAAARRTRTQVKADAESNTLLRGRGHRQSLPAQHTVGHHVVGGRSLGSSTAVRCAYHTQNGLGMLRHWDQSDASCVSNDPTDGPLPWLVEGLVSLA